MDTPRSAKRVWSRCVICEKLFLGQVGAGYCKDHVRYRYMRVIETHDIQAWQDQVVEFTEPSSAEILLAAAMSIRMLNPDGSFNKERTERERGLWLTRKLDALRVQALTVTIDEEDVSTGGEVDG